MKRNWMLLGSLLLALMVVIAGAGSLAAQDATPTPSPLADPDAPDGERDPNAVQAPDACTVPTTQTVRGKQVEFDQCYESTFSHGGTNYTIHVFYTEIDDPDNLAECNATENMDGRCEHKLADNDNGSGDNISAVEMADEAETALRFYLDRNLDMISGTTLTVLIAEDPRGGGINTPSTLYADDELVDSADDLWQRLLAFHEGMHLVQDKYDSLVGWQEFYGEGVARAIEDRVDTTVDADTGHLFIPELDRIFNNTDTVRRSDLATISYSSALWWTWLFDQYRAGGDTEPDTGWGAIRDFYLELDTEANQLDAVNDFIISEGGSFRDDFIDYTLSIYAYDRNPSDPRLTYLDNEVRNNTAGLNNHTVMTSGPAFGNINLTLEPRSSRYIEFDPASQCDFISFTFDGNGSDYGFSVMTEDGGTLQQRWTSYSDEWQRTVRSADLDSVVGVVSAFDNSGLVGIGRGCVAPTLNIKNPTTAAFEMVGTADNPRNFIVRLDVDGEDGSGVAGLVASDFTVELQKAGGGPVLNANILNAVYVQDDYWLLVEAPTDADGAETGQFYNLTVTLGSQSDSENSSVLYVKRTQDVIVVLDRSGSMSFASGKITAARNAATLLINELANDDQGGYVAFDTTADLQEPLDQVDSGPGSHREALELAIAAEVPLNNTSIGDGMNRAATEHDANGIADNMCSFVLLSDGYENTAPFWDDVDAAVVDNGCAIHSIALGPEANELLMQQIAASVPGGSYDYADNVGSVPILAAGNGPAPDAVAAATATLSWQNNLSRVYDAKATQIAGRQRFQTAQSFGPDNEEFQEYRFYVDETVDELVAAVAWQFPTKGEQEIKLFDPDGNGVTPDFQRASENGTNEVLRVNKPTEGVWTLRVANLFQEYFVSISGVSDYELYLFVGTPIDELSQGVKVPLLATFVGPGEPVVGAMVVATVRAPNGTLTDVILHDDGNHGDAEPEDGVYGGYYTATAASDAVVPDKVVENEEPDQLGSYLVTAVGTIGPLRREAQASFAIETGRDDNQNRLPDDWEANYGISGGPGDDDDMDKLTNFCELQIGTNPTNPDTDGGGESDGSEVPECQLGDQDPLNPDDDRSGRILGSIAIPELKRGLPLIVLNWSSPTRGELQFVNIYRRIAGDQRNQLVDDWALNTGGVAGNRFEDEDVEPGKAYEYLIEPIVTGEGGGSVVGGLVMSNAALASEDPYPPSGSILINDGAPATSDLLVTLSIAADDFFGGDDGGGDEAVPGSATHDLEMRISNSADFEGVAWQPFASTVVDWDLGDVAPGETAVVYIQFRDEAGNVSVSGFAQSDSIVYDPFGGSGVLFLPAIFKP